MLYLLGAGERVVGVSHECDWPPEIADKPRLTRSLVDSAVASGAIDDQVRTLSSQQVALYEVDVEALAALRPDLIVTQAQCDVCAVRYEDVVSAVRDTPALHGTPIVSLNPSSLADVFADIARVGDAIGSPDAAREALHSLQARVDAVRAGSCRLAMHEIPRVACLEWIEPPMLAANWTPELVAWAGGTCPLVKAGQHSTYADWQAIVEFDPQVIVIMPCGFHVSRAVIEAQVLPARAGLSQLAAVKQGRVFAVDGNAYFNRSGPRLVDSLEILAHLFHPRLFAAPRTPHQAFLRLQSVGDALVPTNNSRCA